MKRAITTLMATLLLGLAFTACEKEGTTGGNNGGGNNNGPGIELNMSNSGDGNIFFEQNYCVYSFGNNNCQSCAVKVLMSESNNFYFEYDGPLLWDQEHGNHYGSIGEISNIGNVGNLSGITNIPTSGWVSQMAVMPGKGYVIRYRGFGFNYTYARVYVKDWILSTDGGIIGATIAYQDKWEKEQGSCISGSTWKCLQYDRNIIINFISDSTLLFCNYGIIDTLPCIINERHGEYYGENGLFYFYVDNYDILYYYVNDLGGALSFRRTN